VTILLVALGLLAVGALVPYKKFGDAIEAARRVQRPLVLVGKGPEEKRLRALAPSSVRFLRGSSREELRELYRTCAFFVQPGEEDFGIAAAEALACGAPVVALGRGGVLDIVRHGVEGVLFDSEGSEGLAEAILAAEGKRFDYTPLARSAARFSRERFIREFGEEVRTVLK
jgi:glycosyltransferase involved in cell wall biosynthesis